MAATFTVEVVSAERQVLSVEAEGLYITTTVGSMGILPGHQPVLAGLDIAEAHIDVADGRRRFLAVSRGYVYYSGGDTAVILADIADLSEEVDIEEERQQLIKFERMQSSDEEFEMDLPAMMQRSRARIRAAEKAKDEG